MEPKQYEQRLLAGIAQDEKFLDYRRQHFADFDQSLAARKANVKEQAKALAASDAARAQHEVNVKVADRLTRVRIGDAYRVPTQDDVNAALSYFVATEDVFRLAGSCLEQDEAKTALVRIWKQATVTAEQAAEEAAREAVIARLVAEHRSAEYAANKKLSDRLES